MDVDNLLNDPAFFATDRSYELFDRLRREDPVRWTQSSDGRGYWSLFRHADIKHVLHDPQLFSSEREGVFPVLDAELAKVARDAWGIGENIAMVDPPRHTELRKVISRPFGPNALLETEARTKKLIGEIFDRLPEEGEIDLVEDLAVQIPMAVICDILRLPESDWDDLLRWGKMAIGGTDPEYAQGTPAQTRDLGYRFLKEYSSRIIEARRGCPHADPLTRLANSLVQERPLTNSELMHNTAQVILAGFETTRSAFSGGVLGLLERPDQMERLRREPSLLRPASEEFIRWANPVISLMRIATSDTEIGGKRIRENERVILWFPSANRDDTVFDRPYDFDVSRNPNPHLGFGASAHFCLGGPLAKMEIKLALEELIGRYDGIEITGPVERVQSTLVGGLKHLPVRLKKKTATSSRIGQT